MAWQLKETAKKCLGKPNRDAILGGHLEANQQRNDQHNDGASDLIEIRCLLLRFR